MYWIVFANGKNMQIRKHNEPDFTKMDGWSNKYLIKSAVESHTHSLTYTHTHTNTYDNFHIKLD